MGGGVPHIDTELIFHRKSMLSDTEMVEIKIWKVPRSDQYPEGISYSMVYLRKTGDKYRRILGFDNREGKGYHKHEKGKEEKLIFISVEELIDRFRRAVEDIREVNR